MQHVRAALVLAVALALPPADRLADAQAVTIPLFQCDIASAPAQLTVCPAAARQIAHTRIPRAFHGRVRTAARELRAESARCAWVLRAGAVQFLRTSALVYPPSAARARSPPGPPASTPPTERARGAFCIRRPQPARW